MVRSVPNMRSLDILLRMRVLTIRIIGARLSHIRALSHRSGRFWQPVGQRSSFASIDVRYPQVRVRVPVTLQERRSRTSCASRSAFGSSSSGGGGGGATQGCAVAGRNPGLTLSESRSDLDGEVRRCLAIRTWQAFTVRKKSEQHMLIQYPMALAQ